MQNMQQMQQLADLPDMDTLNLIRAVQLTSSYVVEASSRVFTQNQVAEYKDKLKYAINKLDSQLKDLKDGVEKLDK